MTVRRDLISLLTLQPRSVSSIARELRVPRADAEEHLRHAILSAQAAGHVIVVLPARCRTCGFTFDGHRLSKPGRCPACRNSRVFEPQIRIGVKADG